MKTQWNKLIVRDNCHPMKATVLIFLQVPLWVTYSVSIRNLIFMLPEGNSNAENIFKELSAEGLFWIPNLITVDSLLILPITMGLLNLTIIEIQQLSRTKEPTRFVRIITNGFRVFSVLMVPVAASVPSVSLSFF